MKEQEITCPHCTNSDARMMEETIRTALFIVFTCSVCSKVFSIKREGNNK